MSIVLLQDVSVSFLPGISVLEKLDLEVKEGESLSILGPGGCGKSTLLKVILGIVKPVSGRVEVFGKPVFQLTDEERFELLKKIGMAFQQGALFDFMTVRENLFFAMTNMTSFSFEEQQDRVTEFLARVNLPDVQDKLPSELSGGMKRRVGFLRALITNPRIALLDEPTAGLDPVTTTIVIDMLHRLGEGMGSTMVCVTSNVDVAFRFSERVAILKDGRIIACGTRGELLACGNPWVVHFLTVRESSLQGGIEV